MTSRDPRLANEGLLHLAAWSLARQRGQPAVSHALMTDAWLRELFTLMADGGYFERICTETFGWSAAQMAEVRHWLTQEEHP